MKRTIFPAIVLATLFSFLAPAVAAQHPSATIVAASSAQMAEGEVRKVDKDAKKITIRHGPITNLDMPAMTMVFQVKEAAMLDQVRPGDKIRFGADKVGGAYTVMHIEVAK